MPEEEDESKSALYSTPPRSPRIMDGAGGPQASLPPSSPLPPVPQKSPLNAAEIEAAVKISRRLSKLPSVDDFPMPPPSPAVYESKQFSGYAAPGLQHSSSTPSSRTHNASLEADESYQTVDEGEGDSTYAQIPSPKSYRKSRIQYPKKMKEMALRIQTDVEDSDGDAPVQHERERRQRAPSSPQLPSTRPRTPPAAPRRIIGPSRTKPSTSRGLEPPSAYRDDDRAELSETGALPHKRSEKASLRGYNSTDDQQDQEAVEQPWAQAQAPGKSTLPHLPDWNPNGGANGAGRSALPNSHIQRNMDYTLRKLMNEGVFKDLMMDPLGRHRYDPFSYVYYFSIDWCLFRFREFMEESSELDLWTDTFQAIRFVQEWKANAEALHGL